MNISQLETITIEEEQCRPNRCCNYVCKPIVRQVKIRSRPSSCVDLHKKEAAGNLLTNCLFFSLYNFLLDNQWTKVVDERREEHHDWHYNITLPSK